MTYKFENVRGNTNKTGSGKFKFKIAKLLLWNEHFFWT